MYKRILIALDNSGDANAGVELGCRLAALTNAAISGCHVYAACLHDMRFRQMESVMPARFQVAGEIERQREIHSSLIGDGLRMIADSYSGLLLKKAEEAGIEAASHHREGKNHAELVKEAREGSFDLMVMGARGLGSVGGKRPGSVCERVSRAIDTDLLVTREDGEDPDSRDLIMVGIDGSPASYGALERALYLAGALGKSVEAVSVFDPDYHYRAFDSLKEILSERARERFDFEAQEELHEEIIDGGLAKIYSEYLEGAERLAEKLGQSIETTLLSGKPYVEITSHAARKNPFMLVMGKTGFHAAEGLDIGSNTENTLRDAASHFLITTRETTPPINERKKLMIWTEDAQALLEKIPVFVRPMVKKMAEKEAAAQGKEEITAELLQEIREKKGG